MTYWDRQTQCFDHQTSIVPVCSLISVRHLYFGIQGNDKLLKPPPRAHSLFKLKLPPTFPHLITSHYLNPLLSPRQEDSCQH